MVKEGEGEVEGGGGLEREEKGRVSEVLRHNATITCDEYSKDGLGLEVIQGRD